MKPAIILCTLMSLFCASFVSGCVAKEAYDCQRICSRYDDCVPGDQDVSECRMHCRDQDGDNFETQASECQACIDDPSADSCVEEAFQCSEECAGVIP